MIFFHFRKDFEIQLSVIMEQIETRRLYSSSTPDDFTRTNTSANSINSNESVIEERRVKWETFVETNTFENE